MTETAASVATVKVQDHAVLYDHIHYGRQRGQPMLPSCETQQVMGGGGLFTAVPPDDVGIATAQILLYGFTVDLSRPKFDQASFWFFFSFFKKKVRLMP